MSSTRSGYPAAENTAPAGEAGGGEDRLITNRYAVAGCERLRRIKRRDGGGRLTRRFEKTASGWHANGQRKTLWSGPRSMGTID
jgi:hypothetical protein